jgi:hypothetical protein
MSSVWVHHPGLDRTAEVPSESVPGWEATGWKVVERPAPVDDGRFTKEELAARGVSIETPESEPSTEAASLKKDSGSPQED